MVFLSFLFNCKANPKALCSGSWECDAVYELYSLFIFTFLMGFLSATSHTKASFTDLFPESQNQKPQWAEGRGAVPVPEAQSAPTGPQISWGDRHHPNKDIFPSHAHKVFAVIYGYAPTVILVLLSSHVESLLNLWILAFSILLDALKSFSEGLLESGSWSNIQWITSGHTDPQIISNTFEKH